jgi:hypothetical protein
VNESAGTHITRFGSARTVIPVTGLPYIAAVPGPAGALTYGEWSTCVCLEPDGAGIVTGGEADVGIQCRGEVAEQADGGLGAAFFGAFDLVGWSCRPVQRGQRW